MREKMTKIDWNGPEDFARKVGQNNTQNMGAQEV